MNKNAIITILLALVAVADNQPDDHNRKNTTD